MGQPKHHHYGHRKRLKRRFLKESVENFDEHAILELLLFYSLVQKDTNELAHMLIDEFGGLCQVFDAPCEELCKFPYVTEHTCVLLKMIPALARKYMEEKMNPGTLLNSAEAVCKYVKPRFIGQTEERIYMICVDNTNHVIGDSCLMVGSLEEVSIPTEKVVREALKYNVKNVILAHNHPFGLAQPSYNDNRRTQQLIKSLRELEIRLLDHVIVGKNFDTFSMVESGFIHPEY